MRWNIIVFSLVVAFAGCQREEECSCSSSQDHCVDNECVLKPFIFKFNSGGGDVRLLNAYIAIGEYEGVCSDTIVAFKVGQEPYSDLKIFTEYVPGWSDFNVEKSMEEDHLRIDYHYGIFCGPPPHPVSNFHARLYQDSIVLEMGVGEWPEVFSELNEVTLLHWDLYAERNNIVCDEC